MSTKMIPASPVVLPGTALRSLVPLFLLTGVLTASGHAQSPGYHDAAALRKSFDRLAERHGDLIRITDLAESPGGHAIYSVRIGSGDGIDERPALLLIANASGPHVAGSETALGIASRLASSAEGDTAIRRLLDQTTLYIIPRANPDAAEAMFQQPLRERTWNAMPADDDSDGELDEDGAEDLNGDGLISTMRVEDPAGMWIADSADPVLMRKADAARGQTGRYFVMVEGVDDDGDEEWNEDPPGGIDIGHNFSYGYEYFGAGAGLYPFHAPEARAIAQFYVDHPNITAVYVLGPQNNLVKAWEHKSGTGSSGDRMPLTSVMEEDEAWYEEVARSYREITDNKDAPEPEALEGDPLSFAYYHMGRWAFGSPVWWPPVMEKADSTGEEKKKPSSGDDKDDPLAEDRQALEWFRANRPDAILEWTPVSHPDFPGKVVEVGGFRPFATLNPPTELLDSIATEQTEFVSELLAGLPRIEMRALKVEPLGDRVYRITAELANTGYLPTRSALGARVRWPRQVRVELEAGSGQHISGGRAIQLVDAIDGSGRSRELTWVVVGPPGSTVTLTAKSPVGGSTTRNVTLRGTP